MERPDPFENEEAHLLVSAAHGIFSWSASGTNELFTSGSKGIVAATKTRAEDDILAVADSHVVVLHNFNRDVQRTYRLTNSGPPRQLWYDKRNDRLLFSTLLEPAVQVYSLKEEKFLEPATSHPSPPTVFAVHSSRSLDVLLSASANPPTVFVTTLKGDSDRAKCLVQPPCTNSPCSAAAFHPSAGPGPSTVLFVLGFKDGTIAAYSYNARCLEYSCATRWEELASFPRAHVTTTESSPPRKARLRGLAPQTVMPSKLENPGNNNFIAGDMSTAVNAIALVPERICLAVSAGSDGRCCITDFEPEEGPSIVVRWSVHACATALAVRRDSIAIGTNVGRVLIYDLEGYQLFSQDFDGNSIVDLEWLYGGIETSRCRHRASSLYRHATTVDDSTLIKPLTAPFSSKMSIMSTGGSKRPAPSLQELKVKDQLHLPYHNHGSRTAGSERLQDVSNDISETDLSTKRTFLEMHERPIMTTSTADLGPISSDGANMSPRRIQTSASTPSSAHSLYSSSKETVRRISVRGSSPDVAKGGKESSSNQRPAKLKNKERDKGEAKVVGVKHPVVPPRPTRSPSKHVSAAMMRSGNGELCEKASKCSNRPSQVPTHPPRSGRAEESCNLLPAPLAVTERVKGKKSRLARFVEPKYRYTAAMQRHDSVSSTIESDDYEIDWVDDEMPGGRFLPLRMPSDLAVPGKKPATAGKSSGLSKPTLKARRPAPHTNLGSANMISPVTPRILEDLSVQSIPTISATKQHSTAKKTRKASSSRASKQERSPTRSRPRKDKSVELDLLSIPKISPAAPAAPIQDVEGSSGATSSYVTASEANRQAERAMSGVLSMDEVQAEVRRHFQGLRLKVSKLMMEGEKELHEALERAARERT